MKLSVDEPARREIESAAGFYAAERRELAARFLAAVDSAVTLIRENPWLGQRVDKHHRRIPLDRFAYLLIYRVDEAGALLRLVAVSHQRRRPGYWSDGVEEPRPRYVVLPAAA